MPRIARHSLWLCSLIASLAGCGSPVVAPTAIDGPSVAVAATEMTMKVPNGRGALALAVAMAADPQAAGYRVKDVVQSWAASIAHVDFTISSPTLGQPIVASITHTQFIDNKAVVQVNNLAPGPLTISAQAIDANGQVLVSASGTGEIVVNQVATVHLTCQPQPDSVAGHVRIDMGCWTTCGCGGPTPAPSVFVPVAITKGSFKSWGDPHEEGGNGLSYENNIPGEFLALQTLTSDFSIEKYQDVIPGGKWAGHPVNQAVGVQSHGDAFLFYVYGHRVRLNGQPLSLADGQSTTAPHGLRVTRQGTSFSLATAEGDAVTVLDRTDHIDFQGQLGPTRVVNEIRGTLGAFTNGTAAEAMRMRNGQLATVVEFFVSSWVIRDAEELFPGNEPAVPANQAPIPATSADPATATGFDRPFTGGPLASPSTAPTPAVTPTVTATPHATPSPSPSAVPTVTPTATPHATPSPAPAHLTTQSNTGSGDRRVETAATCAK